MDIKIVLVEDDYVYAERLKVILLQSKIVTEQNLFIFNNAQDVIRYCSIHSPDIIISDIYLQGQKTGIDLLKEIHNREIAFILMTSSLDNNLYNLSKQIIQVNYLIKPIQALSLISTVEKILEERRIIKEENTNQKLAVYVKNMKNEYCKVNFCDILLIESQGNYSTIITINQKYTLKESLKSFTQNLDERFIRCHQKYVINSDHIEKITQNVIYIAEYIIPLGRTYKNITSFINKV